MKWKTLAAVSATLNAVLVLWITAGGRPGPSIAPGRVTAGPSSQLSKLQATLGSAGTTNRARFNWMELESADYVAYIANLRGIGCPEQTLRDIFLADVNKLYAPRYAALAGSASELAWWGKFDKKRSTPPSLAIQLGALNDEKKTLLQRLIGPLTETEIVGLEVGAASLREQGIFAFLPEAKQSAVHDLMSRYQALRDWGVTEWAGLTTDERDAKEEQLRAARDAKEEQLRAARALELATLLTPEELREFELRQSPTAEALREQFGKANLTEAEFRELYQVRAEFEQRLPDPKPEDWRRLNSDLAAALGPDRFADVERQNDAMWRALQTMAGDMALPAAVMEQAYATERAYSEKLVKAVGAMFADSQQDPQPVRAIAAEMDARLAATLGPDAAKELYRLGVLPRLVVQDDGRGKNYTLTPGGFSP